MTEYYRVKYSTAGNPRGWWVTLYAKDELTARNLANQTAFANWRKGQRVEEFIVCERESA